mmetsp:Transcript_18297/g.40952  ORF Transcript_18297/g.40952 Transcript_18297/m.40952 type:complete len:84 (+) Transcript_18297:503-754(+)
MPSNILVRLKSLSQHGGMMHCCAFSQTKRFLCRLKALKYGKCELLCCKVVVTWKELVAGTWASARSINCVRLVSATAMLRGWS